MEDIFEAAFLWGILAAAAAGLTPSSCFSLRFTQGRLTEGKGSVRLTASLRYLDL